MTQKNEAMELLRKGFGGKITSGIGALAVTASVGIGGYAAGSANGYSIAKDVAAISCEQEKRSRLVYGKS